MLLVRLTQELSSYTDKCMIIISAGLAIRSEPHFIAMKISISSVNSNDENSIIINYSRFPHSLIVATLTFCTFFDLFLIVLIEMMS